MNRYINGFPDRPPVRPNISLGDSLAGLHAAFGIVMALFHRQRHLGHVPGQANAPQGIPCADTTHLHALGFPSCIMPQRLLPPCVCFCMGSAWDASSWDIPEAGSPAGYIQAVLLLDRVQGLRRWLQVLRLLAHACNSMSRKAKQAKQRHYFSSDMCKLMLILPHL